MSKFFPPGRFSPILINHFNGGCKKSPTLLNFLHPPLKQSCKMGENLPGGKNLLIPDELCLNMENRDSAEFSPIVPKQAILLQWKAILAPSKMNQLT